MTMPDPDNIPVDCDDQPKLTAEEWEYVAAVSDGAEDEDDG